MDMCYNGALVMPSSYAVMDEEEMTCFEGGWFDSRSCINGSGSGSCCSRGNYNMEL